MDTNQFFNDFIKKYPIYQNNRTFQILIDKFKDVFVNDIYEDIPQIFKKLYEQGEIPVDVYDYFLTDIGVSQNLISELSTNEKLIFIKSLSDFQKYKSTVGLVKSVVQAYGDSVEVYELYVDFNNIQNRWECKPYLLYKPEYSDGYNKTIPYKIVYEKIPSLLIHENHLNKMRESKLALFPIKTNIIFVTSNYNQSVTSYLQNLIISVFYNHFYDENIELHFSDTLINCTLHQFFLIWMYLIFTNNSNNIDGKLSGLNILFNKNLLSNTNISIDDLDRIIEEYDAINGEIVSESRRQKEIKTTQLDDFYYRYIHPLKTNIESNNLVLNESKIKSILKIQNPVLINYIDKKILELNNNITFIFNDLIQSIEIYKKTTSSINFIKYFKYFKTFLPTVDLLPIQNTVYKILYYTKPYHTELLDLTDLSMIISNDKFNNIYFTHFYNNNLFFENSDTVELEVFNKTTAIKRILEDRTSVIFIARHLMKLFPILENIDLEEILKFNAKFIAGTSEVNIEDLKKFIKTIIKKETKVPVISFITNYVGNLLPAIDEYIIEENIICLFKDVINEDILFIDDIPIHLYSPDSIDDYTPTEMEIYGYGKNYGQNYGGSILSTDILW